MTRQRLLLATIVALSLTGCGSSTPTEPPSYSEAPPEIQDGFYVENVENITIDLPLDQFFAWRETTSLSDILTPTEGMPAVERTVMLEGGETWGEVGDRRRIELSDGNYAVETILDSTPNRFSYQVWGFTSPAGRFANYATGEFVYEGKGDQTFITWTYRFKPSSFVARAPLSLFVGNSFQPFMENGLANMKAGAEKSFKN